MVITIFCFSIKVVLLIVSSIKFTMQKLEKWVFIASALALVLTSIFSLGYHQFDEHFQILEFAGLKLNLTTSANLP